jgi:methionyl-tRNA synthetase
LHCRSASLSIITEPFLPGSAQKLREFLNLDNIPWDRAGESELLHPGHRINNCSLLFEKIEDSEIENQVSKLLATKNRNEQPSSVIAPAKKNVSYEDFAAMDIRIGTIIGAEKVPKTKKLLKLLIDCGTDKRTVVSGIAEFFEPDEISGKQVAILVNLEPRQIKGIESQGMILMAEDPDGKLVFVSPETNSMNGSVVK